ncbi:ergothioneine biosynthesis glutamate--cysteine ligase EgtA [Catenuloplanes indicus]|uniref:Glutamate--cysteine ligase EgtA n=1 Tax=Catenuloplanes indicus TaxID=137267 RepID=A0AAE4B1P1_9ACTN|nr:ergothioneine biosynthesis glutamate--cysteine ligase EgtA [Catenuloplanes indicus]MDQ0370817.1 glutamate--cysteine ligase [Catenuloplanes indicus]
MSTSTITQPHAPVTDRDQAEAHIASVCFRTGPSRLIGAELEFTVHHADDPARPIDLGTLRRALGPHAPATIAPDSPHETLDNGTPVTVEPGGQVEISSAPFRSLTALYAATEGDRRQLARLLAAEGLVLGESGLDPWRSPRRLLHTPRFDALEKAFDRTGSAGRVMMCNTAGLQACVDAGEPRQLAARWAALYAAGPALMAAFATSHRQGGIDTGWCSARMRAWFGVDRQLTREIDLGADPAHAWARHALAAPLLCVRRDDRDWAAPRGLTFNDWIDGALDTPPTTEDLDYHLTLLFPPIRPRGYLEVRCLDAQPGNEWIAPIAAIAALLADDETTDLAHDLAAPAAGRWEPAARDGLTDPAVARAAHAVLDLAVRRLDRTTLDAPTRNRVSEIIARRLSEESATRP